MTLTQTYQAYITAAFRGRPELMESNVNHSERVRKVKTLLFSDSTSPWFVRGMQKRQHLVTDDMVKTCLGEAKKQRAEKIKMAYQQLLMQLTQPKAKAKARGKIRQKNKKTDTAKARGKMGLQNKKTDTVIILPPEFITNNGLMPEEVEEATKLYETKKKYEAKNSKMQKFLATLIFCKDKIDGNEPLRHIKFANAFTFCKTHMDGVVSDDLPDVFCNFFHPLNVKEREYPTLCTRVQQTHSMGPSNLDPFSEFSRTCDVVRSARVGDVLEARTLKPAWFEENGHLSIAGPLWTGVVLEVELLNYIKIKWDNQFEESEEVEVLGWPRLKYLFIKNRGAVRRRQRNQTEFFTPPPP